MKRLLTLVVLLTLALSACGEGGQPEQPAPQAEPEEPAQEESASGETGAAEQNRVEESSGTSVTTLQGEELSLGEQGEVTALFFMAGW